MKINVITVVVATLYGINFTFALVSNDSEVRFETSSFNVSNVMSVVNVDVASSADNNNNDTVDLNRTAFECKGPSKDELKLYAILSWWMDAVGQVSIYSYFALTNNLHHNYQLKVKSLVCIGVIGLQSV